MLLIPGAAAVLAVGIALTLEQQPEPTPQAPAMAVRDMPAPAPAPAPEAREREPQPEAPTPKPEPAPQPKPAHAKRQPPKAEAKPEDPAPTESIGYLSADADPWAWVLLDGKPIDRTPFFRYPVTAGTHAVTFRAADGRTIERSIDLRRGETRRERVDFTTEAAR
ncbi:MAG: hypothetical protein IPJ65_02855 [Archangiaceae bacterium]|nr:hypothetical protein [Archangiaceae bacterium]